MTAIAEKLHSELLALSEEDREELAHLLFDSLAPVQSDEEDHELLEELARREADMLSGKSVPIPHEEFMAQFKAHVASLRR